MTPNQTLPSPLPEMRPMRLRLERIVDWEPLMAETGYSARNLAARCGYSVRSLQRFVSNRHGQCLLDFIAGLRLERARVLLQAGYSVKETAIELGYKQPSHFCRCFKEWFGLTPSEVAKSVCAVGNEGHHCQLPLGVPES